MDGGVIPFGPRQDVFQAVEVFDACQPGLCPQAKLAQAQVEAGHGPGITLRGRGIIDQHAARLGRVRQPITALPAATGQEQLEYAAGEAGFQLRQVPPPERGFGEIQTQARGIDGEPIQLFLPEAWPPPGHAQAAKNSVAVVQATIQRVEPGPHDSIDKADRAQVRAKMRVPLVPPKPKELDKATFTRAARAVLGT